MLDIYHFSYGWITPVLAYFMSVTGCLLGLQCAARGRNATEGRTGWLIGAAVAIGGTGIWVMHFIAMLGFSIRGADIRYDIPLTLFSAVTAMVVVGIGLFMVNKPQPTLRSLLSGGTIAGLGVGTMHYTGMYAMKSTATLSYDAGTVALSMVIAVVASVVALWFTLRVKGFLATVGAALIMGVAVCGMHYTGMAAMHAHSDHHAAPPTGAGAMDLLAPLIGVSSIVTMLVLISVSLTEIENEEALPRMWLTSRHQPRPRRAPAPVPSAVTPPAPSTARAAAPAVTRAAAPAGPRPAQPLAPRPAQPVAPRTAPVTPGGEPIEYRTEELVYDGAGSWPRRIVD